MTRLLNMCVMRAISLFSGAGGDTLGLQRAGYTVVAFSEMNAAAVATHLAQFPESVHLQSPTGDPKIQNIPDSVFEAYKGQIDVLFAGFPCQGFSHAGKKRSNDARNELVHEFARVARLVQPTWIVGENVKGLLSRKGKDPLPPHDMKPVITIVHDLFGRIGYKLSHRVIDATTVGVPQGRKRLIMVGHRDGYPHLPSLPSLSSSTIRSILAPHLEGATLFQGTIEGQDARYWIPTTCVGATGQPHPNLLRLAAGIRNRSSKEIETQPDGPLTIVEPGGLISFGVRKSGYHGEILDPDAASKTIICAYAVCPRLFVGLYNAATNTRWIRCLTPRELGQIQGFPPAFPWQGNEKEQVTQIGNAVPPALVQHVLELLPRATFHAHPQGSQTQGDQDDSDDES